MKKLRLILGFLLGTLLGGATLLPPGEVQFFDNNGVPLAGGTVMFFVPGSNIPKDTFQDTGQTILNTNPVILDSAGRAIIYGSGAYREVLKNSGGAIIWDQLTSDTSSTSSWAGVSTGTANNQSITVPSFTSNDGQIIQFRAGFTNTGPLTMIVNGINIGVVKDTTAGAVLLTGGEVITNDQYLMQYDSSVGVLHLVTTTPYPGQVGTIASAATTNLGSLPGHFATITGNTTITSFGSSCSASSPLYYISFTGSLTVTNSAAIVTPSGANIQTQSNDSAILACAGSGNWMVLSYIPARSSAGSTPTGAVIPFFISSAVTVTATNPAVFTWTGNKLTNSQNVVLSGSTVPTGFTFGVSYFVVGLSGDTFSLAATLGGTGIAATTAGSGVNGNACPLTWSPADGTGNTVDLRGRFVRGLDTTGTVDPGRIAGDFQGDQFQTHTHGAIVSGATLGGTGSTTVSPTGATTVPSNATSIVVSVGAPISGSFGSETRPSNRSILYCQKN